MQMCPAEFRCVMNWVTVAETEQYAQRCGAVLCHLKQWALPRELDVGVPQNAVCRTGINYNLKLRRPRSPRLPLDIHSSTMHTKGSQHAPSSCTMLAWWSVLAAPRG